MLADPYFFSVSFVASINKATACSSSFNPSGVDNGDLGSRRTAYMAGVIFSNQVENNTAPLLPASVFLSQAFKMAAALDAFVSGYLSTAANKSSRKRSAVSTPVLSLYPTNSSKEMEESFLIMLTARCGRKGIPRGAM